MGSEETVSMTVTMQMSGEILGFLGNPCCHQPQPGSRRAREHGR